MSDDERVVREVLDAFRRVDPNGAFSDDGLIAHTALSRLTAQMESDRLQIQGDGEYIARLAARLEATEANLERVFHENKQLEAALREPREALFLIAHWLDAELPTDDRDVRAIVEIARAALAALDKEEPEYEPRPGIDVPGLDEVTEGTIGEKNGGVDG